MKEYTEKGSIKDIYKYIFIYIFYRVWIALTVLKNCWQCWQWQSWQQGWSGGRVADVFEEQGYLMSCEVSVVLVFEIADGGECWLEVTVAVDPAAQFT